MRARRRSTQAIDGAGHLHAAVNLYSASEAGYYPRRIGDIVEVAHVPGQRLDVVALDASDFVTLRHARDGVITHRIAEPPQGASMTARRLPPFGRQILDARRGDLSRWWGTSADGLHPSITVCCGRDAWDVRRTWPNRLMLVCPVGEGPEVMDWSCCANADPVLLMRCGPTQGNQVQALVAAMMRDGVDRVLDAETGARFVVEVCHAES